MDSKHPGPISNEKLLKDQTKYIRIDDPADSSNYVVRSCFKETVHFKLLSQAVWDLLFAEFGGLMLRRAKDQTNFSYFSPKYKIYHDSFKVMILPPWNEMEPDTLEGRKALKLYYNSSDTMLYIKTKLAAYLSTPARRLTAEDVRLWKPDFRHQQGPGKIVEFLNQNELNSKTIPEKFTTTADGSNP